MTYAADFRWRAISLMHVYGLDVQFISDIFGPKPRTIFRWYNLFLDKGVVEDDKPPIKTARWPADVLQGVERYVKQHPTFYLEELQEFLRENYTDVKNISLSTICRALNFDLGLTRKVITRAARESVPHEITNYKAKLRAIYSYPEQLISLTRRLMMDATRTGVMDGLPATPSVW